MRKRSRHSAAFGKQPLSPLVQLWLLRLLAPLGGQHDFITEHGFSDDALAEAVGLGGWIDLERKDFDVKAIRAELRRAWQRAERELADGKAPVFLGANVERLAALVGLTPVDCRILEFAVLIHHDSLLDSAADMLGALPTSKVFDVLSVLLDVPAAEVRRAFSAQGVLARSGLVTLDRTCSRELRHKFDLLSNEFGDHILSSEADPLSLLRDTVLPSASAQLGLDDYPHLAATLATLVPYLKKAMASGRRGVNIFIHGDPGTGKSQLARALGKELECELFEVASEDSDGDPIMGERRLRAFRAAQSFFTSRRAMILFDEVEDVFNDGDSFWGNKSTAQTRKAWMNRTLEENPVPALWLSNSISGLDPAFMRRFDMVFELPVPPRCQRERILRESCGDLLDDAAVAVVARAEHLAPAVIAKASSVVRSIRDELGAQGSARAFMDLINNTLEAQGHPPARQYDPNRLPEVYDPAFIRADADLAKVGEGLEQAGSGRLCLYGPPGTGKTAYGNWLAERLGKPLLIRRASDLMSMWVGENERNVARAFRDAVQENAVLMIDEVDSFLQDRRGAQRGWEVSLVNEMLTQMESFPGIFIASTNLMEGLDQAALRRFDLKVKFDFLAVDQIWPLLQAHCRQLQLDEPAAALQPRIRQLKTLTPGDFATVARQHRFRPFKSAVMLLEALEAECAIKEGGRSCIGFL
ncbi:AAA family ATPase [Thauera sp.]|uniref:AAA family ATPase n=1 Tax=Thauera sp. TaxID=1905334 RepID=UPI0039E461FA